MMACCCFNCSISSKASLFLTAFGPLDLGQQVRDFLLPLLRCPFQFFQIDFSRDYWLISLKLFVDNVLSLTID